VSTEEQAQVLEGSLESQRHRINAFIEFKNSQQFGWGKAIEIYADEGLSAKDTRRPAFQKMMKDIREGKINLILVTDLSRLSRNIMDFCLLLEDLRKHNAKFLSLKEQFDTSTPTGEMMVFNMINLAQFERKQTSERVAINFHARAMRGLSNGGGLLLGFDKDPTNPSHYKINENESADVREIFRIFLEMGSCGKTIPVLNEKGITPKIRRNRSHRIANQGIWSRQNLLNLLRNPAYAGLREVNKMNRGKNSEDLKPWQQFQVVKSSWPAIVSEETFRMAQAVLDEAYLLQGQRLAKKVTRVFLGTGLLKCGECGASFMGAT
jgi:DNA invertase Pin-like site-specific DNA recombinase